MHAGRALLVTPEKWRVLYPQVVVEGVADRRSAGHIAVDNIQIMDGLQAEDCKGVCRIVMPLLVHQIYTWIQSLCFHLMEPVVAFPSRSGSSDVSTNWDPHPTYV